VIRATAWRTWFRETDPGRLRLKQAVRTTLSCVAVTGTQVLLRRVWPPLGDMPAILMGAMTAVLTVLLISGETRREQQAGTAASAGVGLLVVLLACAVQGDRLRGALALMGLAFAVFFVRRFGARYVGLGIHALFVYVLATIATQGGAGCGPLAAAVAVSVPVAYVVNFHFLPEDRTRLFQDSVFLLLDRTGRVIALLGAAFAARVPVEEADRRMHEALRELHDGLASCEGALRGIETGDEETRRLLERITLHAVRVFGALSLAMDAVLDAARVEGAVAPPLRRELEKAGRILQEALRDTRRGFLRGPRAPQGLARYRAVVNAFYEELLRGEGVRQGRLFFWFRLLLAMQRTGESLEALRGDMVRLQERLGG